MRELFKSNLANDMETNFSHYAFCHNFNNVLYKNIIATVYIRIVFFIFYRHLILIDPMQRPVIGPRQRDKIAAPYPHKLPSGGLAKNSEPIPFEYSCQMTSGGKHSHAFPQKTIKMN